MDFSGDVLRSFSWPSKDLEGGLFEGPSRDLQTDLSGDVFKVLHRVLEGLLKRPLKDLHGTFRGTCQGPSPGPFRSTFQGPSEGPFQDTFHGPSKDLQRDLSGDFQRPSEGLLKGHFTRILGLPRTLNLYRCQLCVT